LLFCNSSRSPITLHNLEGIAPGTPLGSCNPVSASQGLLSSPSLKLTMVTGLKVGSQSSSPWKLVLECRCVVPPGAGGSGTPGNGGTQQCVFSEAFWCTIKQRTSALGQLGLSR
jgi:hypothetical protein